MQYRSQEDKDEQVFELLKEVVLDKFKLKIFVT